jgi:D-arabinose 1-dehydrogenase-like Zn-dependent alcohol dehydrogenase
VKQDVSGCAGATTMGTTLAATTFAPVVAIAANEQERTKMKKK